MRQIVRIGLLVLLFVGSATMANAQVVGPGGQTAPAGPGAGGPAGKAVARPVPPARPAILDQVLATVNGESVTRGELFKMLNETGTPHGANDDKLIYDIGIEGIVNSKLIKQYLKKQPQLTIDEKAVDAEFANHEKQLKAEGEDIYMALASNGLTVPEVRELMRDKLRYLKYLDLVASDANLKKFVAENKDIYNKTQVQASHIVVRVEPDAPTADKEKAKQKLAAIKQEIASGKITFADAANKYSEDEGNKSSPRGGDLGYFLRRGAFNEQFTTAAFGLKKGVVSDPVETPFGYHLILVTDRKEGPPVDFEQAKLLIRNDYAADIMERIVVAERKTAKIKIEPMPKDLFSKPPVQAPGGAAAPPAGKAATAPPPTAPK